MKLITILILLSYALLKRMKKYITVKTGQNGSHFMATTDREYEMLKNANFAQYHNNLIADPYHTVIKDGHEVPYGHGYSFTENSKWQKIPNIR
jgi:hypothetical protein